MDYKVFAHDMADAFSSAVDARSPFTRDHSLRVSELSLAMARILGLKRQLVFEIDVGGHLHDIGRVWVSEQVVNCNGTFGEAEMWEIQRHPEAGHQIIARAGLPSTISDIVLRHHERYDGNGYPGGLAAEEIPMAARLVSVADAYEAMTGGRSHRPALPISEALDELEACSGTQFDPVMVETALMMDLEFLHGLSRSRQLKAAPASTA